MTRYQKGLIGFIGLALLIFLSSVAFDAYSQAKKKAAVKKQEETYTRPKPTKPIKPVIPSQNRYQSDKVFLENADSLYRRAQWNDTTEKQVVTGNVKFRQGSMFMYCDSAYYYPEINSMDAFGHVKMIQGDTLFVYADKLFYDGNYKMAKLTHGPSEPKVRLKDPSGQLETDTLDYDVQQEMGYYGCGGIIKDDVNTLSSVYGQYSSRTKDADFFYDVELINRRDGFRLLSDTLYYNTHNHMARIDSPTEIYGENDTILTRKGWYDTQAGNLEMTSRSIIIHKDSLQRATTLEGDSIVYDKLTRISRAYQYRDPSKLSMPTVITDTAHCMILTGGFGQYNDSTREAYATDYPLLKEYSRPDTLFLRADTIFTFIVNDSVPIMTKGEWRDKVTAERLELMEYEYMPWNGENEDDEENGITPLNAEEMLAILRNKEAERIAENLPAIPLGPREYHVAKSYPRSRFFNTDIQGVADTLEFYENDSLMYMKRKPVVWNGERQVNGEEIIVHFNDSTVDHALLPKGGMMAEFIDEDFYNQLAGKKMEAWFEDDYLKRLYVEGNVQTIFLPMENDSTYNKLVDAESSYMTVDLEKKQVEKIKMWPEVTGNTTPLFLVKKGQKYLRDFQWLDAIRPKRETINGELRWADELGEIPEELEEYFRN